MGKLLKGSIVRLNIPGFKMWDAEIVYYFDVTDCYHVNVKAPNSSTGLRGMDVFHGEFEVVHGIYPDDGPDADPDLSYKVPEPLDPRSIFVNWEYPYSPIRIISERIDDNLYRPRSYPTTTNSVLRQKIEQAMMEQASALRKAFWRDLKLAYELTGDLDTFGDRLIRLFTDTKTLLVTDEGYNAHYHVQLEAFDVVEDLLEGYMLVKGKL